MTRPLNPSTQLATRMAGSMNGRTFTKRALAVHIMANADTEIQREAAVIGFMGLAERALKRKAAVRLANGRTVYMPRYVSFNDNQWRDVNYMTIAQFRAHVEEDAARVQYDKEALEAKKEVLEYADQRGVKRLSEVMRISGDNGDGEDD